MSQPRVLGPLEVKVLTPQGVERKSASSEIQEDVRKYLRLLPEVAEPNLARVREIKDEIRQGAYLTRELVEETATRLTLRFLRRE